MKADKSIIKHLLTVAWPLMLSMTGQLILQLTDGIFLARFSPDAVAASGPAGIMCFFFGSFFNGVLWYSTALIAQCYGKGERLRIGSLVWQGLYLAVAFGTLLLALTPLVQNIFAIMNHPPALLEMQQQYFRISCYGLPMMLISSVLCGFYSGRGDTRPILFIQGVGFFLNIVFDYLLIFGAFGFPRLGVVGAGYATVIAQSASMVAALILVFQPKWHGEYGTWNARYRWEDMVLYFRFGFASGLRFMVEVFAWTAFMLFVGRISPLAVATTNIVFRLNSVTFLPLMGLSEAVRTLVGQAQGRRDSDYATRVTWHGFVLAEAWMLLIAALFLVFPRFLLSIFATSGDVESFVQFAEISALGVVLLRYVAAYSLVDAANCVFVMALQGAGDARWTMIASAVISVLMFTTLLAADYFFQGIHATWSVMTFFVFVMAVTWWWRFHNGKWKKIVVIE